MTLRPPKVGFIPVKNTFFGFQLAEEVRERAINALKKLNLELVIASEEAVNKVEEAVKASRRCVEADVDVALIFFSSWANEEVPNAIASELADYPILLWSIPKPEALISPCGLISASSNLTRLGKKFGYIFGAIDDPKTLKRIESYARVCAAAKRLRRSRIGVVGYNCPGMIDVTFSEMEVKRLGPQLVHLSLADLLDRYESVDRGKAMKDVEELERKVGGVEVSRDSLINAVRMYYALRELSDEHKLDAITVRCWPELREQRGLIPCYGLSRLSDEGVIGTCECDVFGIVTQLITYWLTGLPSFNGDFGAIYPEENAIQLWHCGAASTKLSESFSDIHVRSHAQVGVGVTLEFPLKPGRVTITRITRPVNGKSRILIAGGEVLWLSPKERGNPAKIKLDDPLERFLDALVKGGVEHHLIMAYGDIRKELFLLSEVLDLEPITP
ncbi:MAG: hypothetical protein J7L17_02860 [Thaumarchaeota archaeon]|nr:hypothetical protein [Nitrososphaerota archaeon]